MIITDPIADFLTRIKNAIAVRKKTVKVPYSKMKEEMLNILKKEGYIVDFRKDGYEIEILLKYLPSGSPALSGVRRISKPGCRIYTNNKQILKHKRGYGILIISTPKGLLTDREALKEKVGGELICEVW
jgi:small subunit ribosomal protein S8